MWTALHGLSRLRLRSDRWRGTILTLGRRPRVLATACWRFPIYSQSFVYQELTQLCHQGYDLKFLYSELERRDRLPAQFEALWRGRRRMFLTPYGHEADVEHYRSRLPDRVEALVQLLCAASGLTRPELERHPHFRQSFSYARVVEAFRPRYLHSYFFYEGTLFTFVASYLLRIPRGVSCYADHLLQDYDLKVVALHLRHCALVVATSQRIKRELLQIAPGLDADRILVKPNAINASRFPVAERRDPAAGEPYRLVSVCRLDPKKGLAYLVRAVRILRDRGLNVEVHVVGGVDPDQPASADCARELEADVRALDLTRWVHLEGRRTEADVSGFLQRSHLFVAPFVEMPSGDKDGIPTTLLEAMSTGLAAVATDAGSMTEVVEDGVDGVIVPQRNPQALAAAIAELLEDPARRARLGARAAETARSRFDVSVCEHLFHAALEQVLARPYADTVRPGESRDPGSRNHAGVVPRGGGRPWPPVKEEPARAKPCASTSSSSGPTATPGRSRPPPTTRASTTARSRCSAAAGSARCWSSAARPARSRAGWRRWPTASSASTWPTPRSRGHGRRRPRRTSSTASPTSWRSTRWPRVPGTSSSSARRSTTSAGSIPSSTWRGWPGSCSSRRGPAARCS